MFYDEDHNNYSSQNHQQQKVEIVNHDDESISVQNQIDLNMPGQSVDLPQYVVRQLQNYWPNYKKRLIFFGGHPVSITKLSCNQIFDIKHINQHKQSPYLVCEKTDGVRYILLTAKVKSADLHRQKQPQQQDDQLFTQSYLISRQGQGKITSYVVNIGISFRLQQASSQLANGSTYVIQVLDGQLIKQQKRVRYLIFDGLIHLGRDICKLKLKERLECMTNFIRCNNMLCIQPHEIEVKIKDFFRLSCRKFNITKFILDKYVKCLTHENDGLIFNHEEKEYVLGGLNAGYVKWKPDHLNTVDFMIVPNLNLQQKIGKYVFDLYLGIKDKDLDRYFRQFYAFAIVTKQQFDHYNQLYEQMQNRKYQSSNPFQTQNNEFKGAIIAECRLQTTKNQERRIHQQVCKIPTQTLVYDLMKQSQETRDKLAIQQIKKQNFDKGWKIYKVRHDKSLPNNFDVTKKIEESIRDNISSKELILKNEKFNIELGRLHQEMGNR